MSYYATGLLLFATVVLEWNVLFDVPSFGENKLFYGVLLLNCGMAMASNYLNICVTRAAGPLTLQVRPLLAISSC